MAENIVWLAPSFLWEEAMKDKTRKRLEQPALFRFDNDSFMEELAGRLEKDPSSMKDLAARQETWIAKSSGWLHEDDPKEKLIPKLYQPTHGYFYIAAAMLVCRIPGFPDRKVDTSIEEKVSFVMRRLVPAGSNKSIDISKPDTFTEYAMISEGKGWRKASGSSVADDEERLPLFPMYFMQDKSKRRLLAGLIPVSRKEAYQAEPEFRYEAFPAGDINNDELAKDDPILLEFRNRIILAMEKLIEYCEIDPAKVDENAAREVLANVVLDMAQYIEKHLPKVRDAITSGQWSGSSDGSKQLYDRLGESFAAGYKWKDVLKKDKQNIELVIEDLTLNEIRNAVSVLRRYNHVKNQYDFENFHTLIRNALPPQIDARLLLFEKSVAKPFLALYNDISNNAANDDMARRSFLFILLDLAGFLNEQLQNVFSAIITNEDKGLDEKEIVVLSEFQNTVLYGDFRWDDVLREIWEKRSGAISGRADGRIIPGASAKNIMDALSNLGIVDYKNSGIYDAINDAVLSVQVPSKPPAPVNTDKTAGAVYFLRFVYDRPECRNVSGSIISGPSKPFQFASFYDPDAPGRPLKITMPVDTSIEGLKKYPRNVSFLISDKLRNQMEIIKGVKKITDIDDLQTKKPAFSLGMVCSFSIPIITICALILLMIIVNILNIIFWWLPYFRICLPLNLKLEK